MPRLIGLTGGIGAGKSTVARLLADRGAVIVDADAIARELQKSGTPVFAAMVGRFGESIIGDDGELDREALAGRVFADRDALKDLNAIVHPAVREEMAQQIAAAPEGAIVILDIPLLAESTGRGGMEMVITVEADPATRIGRLVSDRGMEPEAAEARIAAQATEEQRTAVADVVIRNDGSLELLEERVEAVWARIAGRTP